MRSLLKAVDHRVRVRVEFRVKVKLETKVELTLQSVGLVCCD